MHVNTKKEMNERIKMDLDKQTKINIIKHNIIILQQ